MERAPRYRFRVIDDGGGFDPARVASDMHVGLRIMRERAHRIDATLAVRSQPGQGTEVSLELPPQTEQAQAA
jgi:two-component system nitrate/nitrite sensor histidine kinase NarX